MAHIWSFLPLLHWHDFFPRVSHFWAQVSRTVQWDTCAYQEAAKRERALFKDQAAFRRPSGTGAAHPSAPACNALFTAEGLVRLQTVNREVIHIRSSGHWLAVHRSTSANLCANCDEPGKVTWSHFVTADIFNNKEHEWLAAAGILRSCGTNLWSLSLCTLCMPADRNAKFCTVHGVELCLESF